MFGHLLTANVISREDAKIRKGDPETSLKRVQAMVQDDVFSFLPVMPNLFRHLLTANVISREHAKIRKGDPETSLKRVQAMTQDDVFSFLPVMPTCLGIS